MNKEQIIKLAREAGMSRSKHPQEWDIWKVDETQLERFAQFVAAAEREKVVAWMIDRSYATGHGDTIEDLLKELEWQIRESEREACAKVCESDDSMRWAGAAEAIRARGNK